MAAATKVSKDSASKPPAQSKNKVSPSFQQGLENDKEDFDHPNHAFHFVDEREEAREQRELQDRLNNRPSVEKAEENAGKDQKKQNAKVGKSKRSRFPLNPTTGKKGFPEIGTDTENAASDLLEESSKKTSDLNGVEPLALLEEGPVDGASPKSGIKKVENKEEMPQGAKKKSQELFELKATALSDRFPQFGSSFQGALKYDDKKLVKETGEIEGSLNAEEVPAAQKMPVPATLAPEETVVGWEKPKARVRRNDTPKVQLSGSANPQKIAHSQKESLVSSKKQEDSANREITETPGEDRVQGKTESTSGKLKGSVAGAEILTRANANMVEYQQRDLPGDVHANFDKNMAPLIEPHAQETQTKINDSLEKRDKEQQSAIGEAKAKAVAESENANFQQQQEIEKSIGEIREEKTRAIEEGRQKVAGTETGLNQEREKSLTEIDTKIKSAEEQSEAKLNQADKDVHKAKEEGERKKREEKRKAKEKERRLPWYKKIAKFFKSIAKALAKVVTKIVQSVEKAAKAIISAVKKAVNFIVDAAVKVIHTMIDAYASIAKKLVGALLVFFPALKERVLKAIDRFVEKAKSAVNKIGKALKDAINELLDVVNKIVDFAAQFATAAINGALLMFQALLDGDFSAMPKILFISACESLGLPGEEFWQILMKAKNQAIAIVKKPASFLSNLIKASKKGFNQFLNNFKKHLEQALMSWLLGQLAQTDIKIPKTWNNKSVFLLIRQILGVTYEYVKSRVVMNIGEENAERLEYVLHYVKMLFTDGPEAVYNELHDEAEKVRPTLIDRIQEWAITRVVQKATMKIMAALIPGGGFVMAIYGMWQTIQFFLENIRKIAAVVNTLTDSFALIAQGIIQQAANYVEKTIVDTMPLVFAWMAKMIGLGDIGTKIQNIIDKLRTPVNAAVDKMISTISGGAKAAWSGVKKVGKKVKKGVKKGVQKMKTWWKEKKKFKTAQGESHELSFLNEKSPVLMVASLAPMGVGARFEKWRESMPRLKSEEKKKKAKKKINQGEGILQKLPEEKQIKDRGLVLVLSVLFDIFRELDKSESQEVQVDEDAPRDKEEMELDVQEAKKDLSEKIKDKKRSDEIAELFPAIKKKYGLKDISFIQQGKKVNIELSLNPKATIDVSDITAAGKLAGIDPNKSKLLGFKTDVDFSGTQSIHLYKSDKSTISQQDVGITGVGMEANPVGPDHPLGSTPSAAALSQMMGKLPTKPDQPNPEKYIKGHLLNENLGGPGDDPRNLSPFTAKTNKDHLLMVETKVKEWVNKELTYSYYRVTISDFKAYEAKAVDGSDVVGFDSKVEYRAHKLAMDGNPYGQIIHGDLNNIYLSTIPAPPPTVIPANSSGTPAEDLTVEPEVADRGGREYVIAGKIWDLLEEIKKNHITQSDIRDALAGVKGVGEKSFQVIWDQRGVGEGSDISNFLDSQERRNFSIVKAKADMVLKELIAVAAAKKAASLAGPSSLAGASAVPPLPSVPVPPSSHGTPSPSGSGLSPMVFGPPPISVAPPAETLDEHARISKRSSFQAQNIAEQKKDKKVRRARSEEPPDPGSVTKRRAKKPLVSSKKRRSEQKKQKNLRGDANGSNTGFPFPPLPPDDGSMKE